MGCAEEDGMEHSVPSGPQHMAPLNRRAVGTGWSAPAGGLPVGGSGDVEQALRAVLNGTLHVPVPAPACKCGSADPHGHPRDSSNHKV